MTHTKRISEIINSESDHSRLLKVATKARKSKHKTKIVPPPIGHHLAVTFFDKEKELEMIFVDNIDICNSHTIFCFDKSYRETYPEEVESMDIDLRRAKVYYKNDTSIEIIRI